MKWLFKTNWAGFDTPLKNKPTTCNG